MIRQRFGVIDAVIVVFTVVLLVITIIPFWQMFVIAFAPAETYALDPLHLVPRGFSTAVFGQLFGSAKVIRGMGVSLLVVVAGLIGGIVMCAMGAYALNKRDIKGRKFFFRLIIFTMFFNGGIIPMFIWFRKIHITDTLWALFLPSLVNTFYLLLVKNYFSSLPPDLEEAATIDGYNEFQILFRIILPISKPVIAAVSLFLVVQYWNDYYFGMLFIDNVKLYPLGLILRNAVINRQMVIQTIIGDQGQLTSEQYNMALVMVSILPIAVLYPFIQKYFVAGVMIGAIKE